MKTQKDFMQRLEALAHLCREKLPDFVIDLYVGVFRKLGFDLGCRAIDIHILKRKANDRFPSIQDLKELVTPKEPVELDLANECAGRIFEAIDKVGWNSAARAEKLMGDIAWRVVCQFGGWLTICEQINARNATTYRAQFRDAALAAIRLSKIGRLTTAPTFASLAPAAQDKVKSLTEGIGRPLVAEEARINGGTHGEVHTLPSGDEGG